MLMQPIEGLTWYLITQVYFQNMNKMRVTFINALEQGRSQHKIDGGTGLGRRHCYRARSPTQSRTAEARPCQGGCGRGSSVAVGSGGCDPQKCLEFKLRIINSDKMTKLRRAWQILTAVFF